MGDSDAFGFGVILCLALCALVYFVHEVAVREVVIESGKPFVVDEKVWQCKEVLGGLEYGN